MRERLINDGWEFTLADTEEHSTLGLNISVWKEVTIPHDWSVEYDYERHNPSGRIGGFLKSGIGWYRKFLTLTQAELGKAQYLYFDGVYHQSTVYVNGKKYDGRAYGYLGFTLDVTKSLHQGLNVIMVRVDCSDEPSSRWYNGCGIHRDVYLLTTTIGTYIPQYGMQIITNKHGSTWQVQAHIKIIVPLVAPKNPSKIVVSIQKDHEVITEASCMIDEGTVDIQASSRQLTHARTLTLSVGNPKLWSPDSPELYTCKAVIHTEEGKDIHTEQFGFRKIQFIPQQGLFINEKPVKLKGMCLHHDAGSLGAATWKEVWEKRLLMLKEMGCNAIRTTSNPYPSVMLSLCDELGILVMDECFDGWDIPKAHHDYGYLWEKNYKKDLADFIERDKNHPSIFIWSIGNEVLKMKTELTKELMNVAKSIDPTRSITCGVNDVTETSDSNRSVLDVAGYNDGGGACFLYDNDHAKRPKQLMIATEAPHTLQTRGFYRTLTWWRDKNQPRIEIPNLTKEELFTDQKLYYSSSYDNCGVRTCARDSWEIAEQRPFLCGEFRWSAFDYLGEVFVGDFPMRMGNFGIIDTANFPKDHYYLYQSMWTQKPMLHILPHWTHRYLASGTAIPVWVYTNCQDVELFLNGESLRKQTKGKKKHLSWMVPYNKGILEARATTQDGTVLCKQVATAGEPAKLLVSFEALGDRMNFVTAEIQDTKGVMVPYADSPTAIHTTNCVLMGSDNGCPDDVTHLQSPIRRGFNGLCRYIVRFDEATKDMAKIILGGILGNRYFDTTCHVTIQVGSYTAWGTQTQSNVRICYTIDGTTPKPQSSQYTNPLCFTTTTCLKVKVFDADTHKTLLTLQEVFIKGRPEPVRDEAHVNFELNKDKPAGPFSDKLVGHWQADGYTYTFCKDGTLLRYVGTLQEKIGYWWYDFPTDCFETPDYAGTGEIWFITGEKNPIAFDSQTCTKLVMDNANGAISAAWKQDMVLEFYPVQDEE